MQKHCILMLDVHQAGYQWCMKRCILMHFIRFSWSHCMWRCSLSFSHILTALIRIRVEWCMLGVSGGCLSSCMIRVWSIEGWRSCRSPPPATRPCPTSRPIRTTRCVIEFLRSCAPQRSLGSSLLCLCSSGRAGPVCDRDLPSAGGPDGQLPCLDHHAMDAAQQPGPLRQPRLHLRQGQRCASPLSDSMMIILGMHRNKFLAEAERN